MSTSSSSSPYLSTPITIRSRHTTDGLLSPTSPLVVVNSVCPGMVKTDIGRHIASRSWFHELCVFLTLLITAKTAESGSRICVMAALKPKENHVSGGLYGVGTTGTLD